MGNFLYSVVIISPLIFLVGFGNALRHFGFMDAQDAARLNKFLYWLFIPSLTFRTVHSSANALFEYPNLFWAQMIAFVVAPAAAWGLARTVIHKDNRPRQAFSTFAVFRANNIYLGFPVVQLVMGAESIQYASIALAVCLPGYHMLSIMWGELVLQGRLNLATLRNTALRVVTNPILVACFAGLATAFLITPVIPGPINMVLKILGDCSTGVALIGLGAHLKLPELPRGFIETWPDVLLKLFAFPAFLWVLLRILPVSPELTKATMLLSCMPTAVNCYIIAKTMGMDGEYAAQTVATCMVCSVVSIPIWINLLGGVTGG